MVLWSELFASPVTELCAGALEDVKSPKTSDPSNLFIGTAPNGSKLSEAVDCNLDDGATAGTEVVKAAKGSTGVENVAGEADCCSKRLTLDCRCIQGQC